MYLPGGVTVCDQLEQSPLGSQPAPSGRQRPHDVAGLAHRGDGAHDDLVEHLGHDGERLVTAEGDEPFVELGVGNAERLRILDRLLFLVDQAVQLGDRGPPASPAREHSLGEGCRAVARQSEGGC